MCTGKYVECSKVVETKPKRKMTRRQAEVMALRVKLPELTEAQRQWMMSKPWQENPHGYYWRRGKVWCMECGGVSYHGYFTMADTVVGYKCPHCGRMINITPYNTTWRGHVEEVKDCTVITSVKGYTVLRTFQVRRVNILNYPTSTSVHEVYQNWVGDDGKETIIGRQYSRSLWNMRWHYGSEWSPKHHTDNVYTYSPDVFSTKGNFFYPRCHVSAILKRNGWKSALLGLYLDNVEAMRMLLTMPDAEMLVKTGQLSLFEHFVKRGVEDYKGYLHAVRICNRNGYIIPDGSVWVDYIDLLQHFGKDTHNAFYVCPDDLSRAHDRLLRRKREEETMEKRKKASKYNRQYEKTHGRFFGICFSGNGISVHVISSVSEMCDEGTVLHHCVYDNGYYKRKDSLILSARDKNNIRLETVEVSTKTWNIVQSRGLCNNPSKRHDDIIKLVTKNMYKLKKVA